MTKADQPTPEAFAAAAWMLACDVAAIRAVAEVESGPYGAFNDDGSPVILYEAHYFHRLTSGRFAKSHPDLSYPNWKPGNYGSNALQHDKLRRASALNREAAQMSCSWGLFQIMGENFRRAGHVSIQRFVNAAFRSADDHLRMFVNFIQSNGEMHDALRAHDWPTFASKFNGPGYKTNRYDEKMTAAYARLNSPISSRP